MTRRHRQRGFTLIELMTVLAIIGILTFALASVSGGSGAATPRTFADRMTGLLQLGRLRAEARRHTHQIQVSTTSIALYESPDVGLLAFNATGATLVQSIDVPSGVVVSGCTTSVLPSSGNSLPGTTTLSVDIRPDGQTTGGTVFLSDVTTANKFRVFIYKVTGTALSREDW